MGRDARRGGRRARGQQGRSAPVRPLPCPRVRARRVRPWPSARSCSSGSTACPPDRPCCPARRRRIATSWRSQPEWSTVVKSAAAPHSNHCLALSAGGSAGA
eukprot:scaffold11285_cov45-Phaeocystis_antarctica.AAC.3